MKVPESIPWILLPERPNITEDERAYAVHAANLYPEMLEVLRDLVAISHEVSTRNELAGRAYILIKKAEKA